MGEVLASLDGPGWATFAAFALAAGAAVLIPVSRHVGRAWHQWRLDWRLARDPSIQREELGEYRFKIGEDLPPLDPARLAGAAMLVGTSTAVPAWLLEQDLQHLVDYGHWLALAAGLLYGAWRWLNDPPEMQREDGPIPALRGFLAERDAVLGLGLAVIVVLVILGLVTMVF